MDEQRGYTMVEMIVVVGVVAFMAGLSTLAGLRFVWASRVVSEASRLADRVSIAREQAIAGHSGWRFRFVTATQYVLESCPLSAGQSVADCNVWQQEGNSFTFGPGVMARYDDSMITFDRTGKPTQANHFVAEICAVLSVSGTQECRLDTDSRFVVVRKLTGIVDIINSRSDIR